MKKGFTLIELLAVIVILAIIALISVPIVLNIIGETKKTSVLISADFYLDAVELSIVNSTLKDKNTPDNTYNILPSGNICLENYNAQTKKCEDKDNDKNIDELVIETNGKVPKEGIIKIENGNIKDIDFSLNGKRIIKNSKGEIIYFPCTLISGQANTIGSKYECEVKNGVKYNFYVLSYNDKEGNPTKNKSLAVTTNLIMDRNINSDGTPTTKAITKEQESQNNGIYNLVPWINKADYLSAGGTSKDWDNYLLTKYGPLTALNFISEATKDWINMNEMIIDTFEDVTGLSYNMQTYNTYARLPYYSEISNISTSTIWLIDYLHGDDDANLQIVGRNGISNINGYWAFSISSSSVTFCAHRKGNIGYAYANNDSSFGVRPVISLKL